MKHLKSCNQKFDRPWKYNNFIRKPLKPNFGCKSTIILFSSSGGKQNKSVFLLLLKDSILTGSKPQHFFPVWF